VKAIGNLLVQETSELAIAYLRRRIPATSSGTDL
jgi:hypothetical protein